MNLLGLDLASRLTGWCAGDGAQIPQCGAWKFPPIDGDYGLLLATLQDYLDAVFGRFTPGAVAYEAPILIARRRGVDPLDERGFGDTLGKLRLLYPMGAFVEFYCRRAGVPCYEVTVAEIKKEVTGNRYAEKQDLIGIAEKCGLVLPSVSNGADDAADAFGAWLLLLRSHDKARSAEWDRRIWTPRGALL
jgi:hypothetical protein